MNAPGATLVRLRKELALKELEIPGGTSPVRTTQLHRDQSGSILLVHFPAGWARPVAGSYACAEEFIVLEGSIKMNGLAYGPGDWVLVPKDVQREDTRTPAGALALARFDGKPRWTEGTGVPAMIRGIPLFECDIGSDSGPLGLEVTLNEESSVRSILLRGAPATDPISLDAELLEIQTRTWAFVPAGSPLPQLDGRVFCRTFSAGGEA